MKDTNYYIHKRRVSLILIPSLILVLVLSATAGLAQEGRPIPEFKALEGDTSRFIDYYYSIKLSSSEEVILKKALADIPAPCCSDYPALSC